MKGVFLPVAAAMLSAGPVSAKESRPLCPADIAGAKAVTASLTATGQPMRNPSSGYERVTYENPKIRRLGRPIQKIVVERSGRAGSGAGHYQVSFFAPGTATDLIPLLRGQLPAAKCEDRFCSGSVATFPAAEGLLEYAYVNELSQGKVEVKFLCKYRDDAYAKRLKQD